jgi:tRNA wybutosine-synthesizing protein 3
VLILNKKNYDNKRLSNLDYNNQRLSNLDGKHLSDKHLSNVNLDDNLFLLKKQDAINFLNQNKVDNSKKGSVDKQILSLLKVVNSLDNYYTTSSCAGRHVILNRNENKKGSSWLFSTHELLTKDDIDLIINEIDNLNLSENQNIFFITEGVILHIGAKSIDDAKKLLNISLESGFKKSGIRTISKRIILEIYSSQNLYVPLVINSKRLFSNEKLKEYLLNILPTANEILLSSRNKAKLLEEKIISLNNA